jgi:hypothetical protein
MTRETKPKSSRFSAIAYSVGLAIIFSATILNLCLHKLPPKHFYQLPSFLVEPYERAGNMGVTLVLAGFGLFIVLLGFLGQILAARSSRTGGFTAADGTQQEQETAYSDPRIAPPTATASSGTMVLETTKYLGKKPSALPGSTVIVPKEQ